MGLVESKDYVFCPKAGKVFDKGIVIGTKAYLIFVPEITKVFEGSKRITKTYSVAGVSIAEATTAMLSKEPLDEAIIFAEIEQWDIPGTEVLAIKSLDGFKINSNWLNSSIVIKKQGVRGWKPFCSSLGKSGKSFKAFYQDMEKR